MSNPTDLRVIKTRQAIRIALISLLSEKELSDITISELSARAQVNRKTFYRHYRSISDVVTEFENELLSDFSDILKTSNTSIFNIGSVLGEISALISSNQEYFVKLLKLNPELFSTGRVKAMLRRAIEIALRDVCGVNDEQIAAFQRECDEQYGENAALNPNNIIESKKFAITTPAVKLSIAPENSFLIEARVIIGRIYLLIPADDGVEVNGIGVNIPGLTKDE